MSSFTVYEALIFEIAREIRSKLKLAVINDLKEISSYMLSGDDSNLKNTWEEYCVDLQQGTFYSEVYNETVETHIVFHLDKCSTIEKAILFLDTEESFEVVEKMEEGKIDSITQISNRIPIDDEPVLKMIREEIEAYALNYSNQRIRRVLEDDYEEVENDEDEEADDGGDLY